MKIVKKLILYVLSFLLVISSASVYTVFAEGAQPLPYLCDEEGNDVTPEKLRQVQREKGLHGRSLDDPNS